MSAHRLSNPDAPVRVADELESFLHILLHHAIRSLLHNLTCLDATDNFVDAYFDGHLERGNERICPPVKMASIMAGRPRYDTHLIRFTYAEDGTVLWHPINGLIETLFKPIQARYSVLCAKKAEAVLPAAPSTKPLPARYRRELAWSLPPGTPTTMLQARQSAASASRSVSRAGVSRADEELARKLDHEWFIDEFQSAVFDVLWPENDRVSHQPAHTSTSTTSQTAIEPSGSSKRRMQASSVPDDVTGDNENIQGPPSKRRKALVDVNRG